MLFLRQIYHCLVYIYFSILYRSVQKIIICIFGINRIITSSLFDSSLPRLKIRLGRRKRGGEESFKFRLPIVDKKIHVGRDGTSGRENAIKVNLPPPIPWLMT